MHYAYLWKRGCSDGWANDQQELRLRLVNTELEEHTPYCRLMQSCGRAYRKQGHSLCVWECKVILPGSYGGVLNPMLL